MTRSATISGVGSSLPPRLVPNTWFEDKIETSDEWIRERTGIEARHFVDEGVDTSDLVVEAATAAMATAAISPDQLDMIVVASVTGDTPFPATAVWAQEKLGVRVPAFDVNAACAGFSYGLASATAFALECPVGTAQAFAQTASPANVFTLTPAGDLPYSTTCTVTIAAGRITDADSDLLIVVLSRGNASYSAGIRTVEEVARLVRETVGG